MARPTKYKEDYADKAEKLYAKGFTDVELADFFGVTEKTINNWKLQFPEFLQSLKSGKEIADSKVERSLFQRATGYSHPDIHISNFQGKVTTTPIIKHYPPDVTAQIFWLKNRKPDEWADRNITKFENLPEVIIGGKPDNQNND